MGRLQTEVSELEARIEKDTARLLRENRNCVFAVRLAQSAQKEIDRIREQTENRGVRFDCKKGCTICCRLEVHVLPQESFRIARELRGQPNRESLVAALSEHVEMHRGITETRQRKFCPFLVEGACSIYELRPLACRKMVSLDVERCKQMGKTVPSDPEMSFKSDAVITGTRKAYARLKLPSETHEMITGVLLALTDPSAEERWWNGEDVFETDTRPAS
ncbi:MAG: YkgJ family cysteine cluster protein [Xanthomonadaceae bacterium]|nr:YkgJ family cysteine cluster protein [Xanthomonadaceae bacterium]